MAWSCCTTSSLRSTAPCAHSPATHHAFAFLVFQGRAGGFLHVAICASGLLAGRQACRQSICFHGIYLVSVTV